MFDVVGVVRDLIARVKRIEAVLNLTGPQKDCAICKGTGEVNWGTREKIGGKRGPCFCVQPPWRKGH